MSCEATPGLMPAGAQQGRGRFIRPKRASAANMIRSRRPRLSRRARFTARGKRFFKGTLRRNVLLRMERTRHQFALAMPAEKFINGAVAGLVADGLLIGQLEITNVQHL